MSVAALPELCFVLPSGDVLDFVEYGDNIPLPEECPSDEWAGIYATVRIQMMDNVDEVTNVFMGSTTSVLGTKRSRS